MGAEPAKQVAGVNEGKIYEPAKGGGSVDCRPLRGLNFFIFRALGLAPRLYATTCFAGSGSNTINLLRRFRRELDRQTNILILYLDRLYHIADRLPRFVGVDDVLESLV